MWLLNGYGTLVLFSYPENSLETVRYFDVCTFVWPIDFLAGEKISCHLHHHLLEKMAWQGGGRFWCLRIWLTVALSLTIMTFNFIASTFTFLFLYLCHWLNFNQRKTFQQSHFSLNTLLLSLLFSPLRLSLKNSLRKRWKIVMFARLTDWLSYQRKTLQTIGLLSG